MRLRYDSDHIRGSGIQQLLQDRDVGSLEAGGGIREDEVRQICRIPARLIVNRDPLLRGWGLLTPVA